MTEPTKLEIVADLEREAAQLRATGIHWSAGTVAKGARTIEALYEALAGALPANVCLTNANVSDDAVVALECPMGDLRRIAAALKQVRGEQ